MNTSGQRLRARRYGNRLPHTWYNVGNDDEKYWIGVYNVVTNTTVESTVGPVLQDVFPFPKMYSKSGFYDDGETFASSLTHQVARAFADIPGIAAKIHFDKRLDRIRMQIRNSPETTVILSADLLKFMGFPRRMIVLKELDRVGSKPFDVNRGLNLMYVYCDVASHGIVGDTKTPLLRVFNPGRYGDLIRLTYDRPHYVSIGRREFDYIAITINNELGEPISIRSDQFVTTLHIRRRRRNDRTAATRVATYANDTTTVNKRAKVTPVNVDRHLSSEDTESVAC
jgi:hypothetical protein